MPKSIHVPGPFGGCDEQAETENFEAMVGGPDRAFRLMRIMTEPGRRYETALKVAAMFYTRYEILAWEHLQ